MFLGVALCATVPCYRDRRTEEESRKGEKQLLCEQAHLVRGGRGGKMFEKGEIGQQTMNKKYLFCISWVWSRKGDSSPAERAALEIGGMACRESSNGWQLVEKGQTFIHKG